MIKKFEADKKTYLLVYDTMVEYKQKFRKHRKDVNHFSQNGLYQEWKKISNREDNDR